MVTGHIFFIYTYEFTNQLAHIWQLLEFADGIRITYTVFVNGFLYEIIFLRGELDMEIIPSKVYKYIGLMDFWRVLGLIF